jgi:circadian clock protein KaiC
MSATSVKPKERRVPTGVQGLDHILGGGLPANHVYLIEGAPGTGKTTMALQFLLDGLRHGEQVLYVTLSETKDELEMVAQSHGWSLQGMQMFELGPAEGEAGENEQYTVFHPAEVELSETAKRVCAEVDRIHPTRVIFDSLSEMRLLAREPLRYRRQVLALKQFFAGRQCTVILLDERSKDDKDAQLQSICHGAIGLERMGVEYGGARRRLCVEKIRGLRFIEGYHDFVIREGGVVVFPRMVAAHTRVMAPILAERELATSNVQELDTILGGGLHFGTSVLIMGPAGTGKSTLLTQYGLALAEAGHKVSCYVFEETRENFLERAEGLGIKLRDEMASGKITVEQIDPAEISPGEFASRVREAVEKNNSKAILIDSLNGYLNSMPSESFLVIQMHELLTFLNERGILTLLTLAQQGLLGPSVHTAVDLTYLADTVIVLRYFEAFGEVMHALAVIKKRTGGHEHTIRQFHLTSKGIQIGEPLKAFEGVLTGVPVYKGRREALFEEIRG